MGISFYARAARLVREAREELQGHPGFENMLRSELDSFAKSKKFPLDNMLNDAAFIDVLTKKFSKNVKDRLKSMSMKKVKAFIVKYQLSVTGKKLKKLKKDITSLLKL